MTDFFDDLERELRRAHRRDTASRARSRLFDRRLLSVPLAAAAAVGVVVVVLAVLGASDTDTQPHARFGRTAHPFADGRAQAPQGPRQAPNANSASRNTRI